MRFGDDDERSETPTACEHGRRYESRSPSLVVRELDQSFPPWRQLELKPSVRRSGSGRGSDRADRPSSTCCFWRGSPHRRNGHFARKALAPRTDRTPRHACRRELLGGGGRSGQGHELSNKPHGPMPDRDGKDPRRPWQRHAYELRDRPRARARRAEGYAIRITRNPPPPQGATTRLPAYSFSDFDRRGPMLWLGIGFVMLLLASGRLHGLALDHAHRSR